MELNYPRNSMENFSLNSIQQLHGAISMELPSLLLFPWSTMEFHGIPCPNTPWNSIEFHGVPWKIFHGVPSNSMKLFHTGCYWKAQYDDIQCTCNIHTYFIRPKWAFQNKEVINTIYKSEVENSCQKPQTEAARQYTSCGFWQLFLASDCMGSRHIQTLNYT